MIRLALILAAVTACQPIAPADSGVPQQADPAALAKVATGGVYRNIQRGDDFFPMCEAMNHMYIEGESGGCSAGGFQSGCRPDYTCNCCRCDVTVSWTAEESDDDCLSAAAAVVFGLTN